MLQLAKSGVNKIIEKYVNTGKLRFVYHPMAILGNESMDAENAGLCAREIGGDVAFFKMLDKLYLEHSDGTRGVYTIENLKKYASEIGFGSPEMAKCIEDGKFNSFVNEKTKLAKGSKISISPTYALNGIVLGQGTMPYKEITRAIDNKLN